MHKLLALPLLAVIAACTVDGTTGTQTASGTEEVNYRGRTLAQALDGRVAGAPVNCVPQRDLAGNESFGEGTILFRGRSNAATVYVNRPAAGCPIIDPGRAIRVRTPSTNLCRGDIVEVFDPVSGNGFGGCGLGDFVPYRRAG